MDFTVDFGAACDFKAAGVFGVLVTEEVLFCLRGKVSAEDYLLNVSVAFAGLY